MYFKGFEYENVEEISPPNVTRIPVRELRTFVINNISLMKTQFQVNILAKYYSDTFAAYFVLMSELIFVF